VKLRNQALQRGTSALVSSKTHVENGSKIAKGHDSLDGVMSQFSSLMSVMQEDFNLMGDMEREYEGEKSEVEPTLPTDPSIVLEGENDEPIFEDVLEAPVSEVPRENFEDIERDYTNLVSDTVPLSLQEMTEHPALFEQAVSLVDDVVPEEITVQGVDPQVAVAAPAPIDFTPVQGVDNQSIVESVKRIVVQTPQQIPEVLVEEVVQSLQPMLVEEIEVEEDPPRFEQSERVDLPDFMREEVRLLDDEGALPDEIIDTADASTLKSSFEQAVQAQVDDQIQTAVPQMSDVQTNLQSMMSTVIAQGTQSAQTIQPAVAPSADGVSVQQQKTIDSMKELKLPKLPLTRQHFEELLAESQEKGTEQMGFRSKLIQRLEMVIMDPMGRMDVEVAQEVSGVNVKAVVPVEIVSSLMGLESDLQVALDQQGLELNNFELYERTEDAQNIGRTDGSDDEAVPPENDLNENSLTGGMLVNRRV